MGNEELRTEALVTATEALTVIREHTKSCDARYTGIENGNKATHRLIQGLYSRFWIIACSVIAGLGSLAVYLLTHNIHIVS